MRYGQHRQDRTEKLMVRVTPAELESWRAHVRDRRGTVSSLVRSAVAEHLATKQKPGGCRHYD